METLNQLIKDLTTGENQAEAILRAQQEVDSPIKEMLDSLNLLKRFDAMTVLKVFAKEMHCPTIKELIAGDDSMVMFSVENITYTFTGYSDSVPLFREIGKSKLVELDLSLKCKLVF